MPDIVLPLISKPLEGTRKVIKVKAEHGEKGVIGTNYRCGNCGNVLLSGAHIGQIQNIVFHCSCGAYNNLP
jgi:hypothetical protein